MLKLLDKIALLSEIVAAATAILYHRKLKRMGWGIFPFYLALIVSLEFTGIYFAEKRMYTANFYLYSYLSIPIEFLFFIGIFFKKYKNLASVSMAIYLLSLVSDILYFRRYQFNFYSFSYCVGNALLLVLILLSFIQIIASNQVLTLRENMFFWITCGLLIFYLGSFPYYGLRNLLVYKYPVLNNYYSDFVDMLNISMYLTFTGSFICVKEKLSNS